MKLDHITILFAMLAPYVVSAKVHANSKAQKPASKSQKAHETQVIDINVLLAYAYEQQDLEGTCAKQACLVTHPDLPLSCTPTMINTYRAECAGIMRRSGLKKNEHIELAPDMKKKLDDAMKWAEGMVMPAVARGVVDDEGDVDLDGMLREVKKAQGGDDGMGGV